MMRLTEENWAEGLVNLPKVKEVIVQVYRPDVGGVSGREDYQPFWAGRADDISETYDCEALTMMIRPCINADKEIPSDILLSLIKDYERTGRNHMERNATRFYSGVEKSLKASHPAHRITMADMANVIFPDIAGQGGYVIVYE